MHVSILKNWEFEIIKTYKPEEEGGLSDKPFLDWLESHMLGLWPENDGIDDTLSSKDTPPT